MNQMLSLISFLYEKWISRLEKKIGYKIKFNNLPQTWINGWMTFDMGKSWKKHGIRAVGINYFTMGSIKRGLSTRFLRSEKQYQSWLGAYLVQFKEDRVFTLQEHYNLAIADQKNWLKDFGDPKPYYDMPEKNTLSPKKIDIGKWKAKLYEFLGGVSHSDVGNNSDNFYNWIIMNIMSAMFNSDSAFNQDI